MTMMMLTNLQSSISSRPTTLVVSSLFKNIFALNCNNLSIKNYHTSNNRVSLHSYINKVNNNNSSIRYYCSNNININNNSNNNNNKLKKEINEDQTYLEIEIAGLKVNGSVLTCKPKLENGIWKLSTNTIDEGKKILPILLSRYLFERYSNLTDQYTVPIIRFISLPIVFSNLFRYLDLEKYIVLDSHVTSQLDKNYIYNNYLVSLLGQIYLENGESPIIKHILPKIIEYLDNLSESELELYKLNDYSKKSLLNRLPQISVNKLPIPIWFSSIVLSSVGQENHLNRVKSLLLQQGRSAPNFQLVQEIGRGSRESIFFVVLYNEKSNQKENHDILGYGAGNSIKVARLEAATDALVRQLCYPQNK